MTVARTTLHRLGREQVLRRFAFLLLRLQPTAGPVDAVTSSAGSRPSRPGDVRLLAMVAHWREDRPRYGTDDCIISCLANLFALTVSQLQVVVHTNQPRATADLLRRRADEIGVDPDAIMTLRQGASTSGRFSIVIEPFRPRWPYRHGHYLTWQHKRTLAEEVDSGRFTHFLYLEDDIAFTTANLDHWLEMRPAFAAVGLLPGFVRFERLGDRRLLTDQTRSGQYEDVDLGDVPWPGGARLVRSLRPYQACFLLDLPLARHHLSRSPMRSPLRSRISRWGVRERAAAGEALTVPARPLRGMVAWDAKQVEPASRYGVMLVPSGLDRAAVQPVEASLIEHLRPTYAHDPGSRAGKVPVERF